MGGRLQTKESQLLLSATKMTGRPGHWSEPGEYNILFLGSIWSFPPKTPPHLGVENSHKRVP